MLIKGIYEGMARAGKSIALAKELVAVLYDQICEGSDSDKHVSNKSIREVV